MTTADILAIIGTLGTLIIAAAGWLTYLHTVRLHRITADNEETAAFRATLERRFREGDEALARRDEALDRRFKSNSADIDAITAQVICLQSTLARNSITRDNILHT